MSAVLVVAARELRERRLFVTAAVVFAVAGSALIALARSWPAFEAVAEATALIGAFAIPVASALGLGLSAFGDDLASGRLRFYLSRPIGTAGLVLGKFLAAALLVVLCTLLGFVPFLVLEGLKPMLMFMMLLTAFFWMGLGHLASTLYRARSPWMLADVLAAMVVAAAWLQVVRAYAIGGAFEALFIHLLPALIPAVTVCVVVAAVVQIGIGRADGRRGHRAFSSTFWPLALLLVAGVAGFGSWLRSATPQDAGLGFPIYRSSTGTGLIMGSSRHAIRLGYEPAFVIDTSSGAFASLGMARLGTPVFTADGRKAVWVAEPPCEEGPCDAPWLGLDKATLGVARFEGGTPIIEERPLARGAWSDVVAVSHDGAQLLVKQGRARRLALVAFETGEPSAWLEADVLTARFLDDGRVRVWAREGPERDATVVALDWSPADGRRTEVLRMPGMGFVGRVEDGGQVALLTVNSSGRTVIDVGAAQAHRFPDVFRSLLLSDGTVALSMSREVHIVSRTGETLRVIGVEGRAVNSMEMEPGRLALNVFHPGRAGETGTRIVDAATGRTLREDAGLSLLWAPLGVPVRPGSPGARLFSSAGGGLVALEADGRRRTVVADPK